MTAPHVQAQMEFLRRGIKTVVPGRSGLYVSTPITSGRLLVGLIGEGVSTSHVDWSRIHSERVIQPNIERAAAIVAKIRAVHANLCVIDPTSLENIEGWQQPDYRLFWTNVIREFTTAVAFVDGWEFSEGCCHEMIAAVSVGSRVLDENLEVLTAPQIVAIVEAARTVASLPPALAQVQEQIIATLAPAVSGR